MAAQPRRRLDLLVPAHDNRGEPIEEWVNCSMFVLSTLYGPDWDAVSGMLDSCRSPYQSDVDFTEDMNGYPYPDVEVDDGVLFSQATEAWQMFLVEGWRIYVNLQVLWRDRGWSIEVGSRHMEAICDLVRGSAGASSQLKSNLTLSFPTLLITPFSRCSNYPISVEDGTSMEALVTYPAPVIIMAVFDRKGAQGPESTDYNEREFLNGDLVSEVLEHASNGRPGVRVEFDTENGLYLARVNGVLVTVYATNRGLQAAQDVIRTDTEGLVMNALQYAVYRGIPYGQVPSPPCWIVGRRVKEFMREEMGPGQIVGSVSQILAAHGLQDFTIQHEDGTLEELTVVVVEPTTALEGYGGIGSPMYGSDLLLQSTRKGTSGSLGVEFLTVEVKSAAFVTDALVRAAQVRHTGTPRMLVGVGTDGIRLVFHATNADGVAFAPYRELPGTSTFLRVRESLMGPSKPALINDPFLGIERTPQNRVRVRTLEEFLSRPDAEMVFTEGNVATHGVNSHMSMRATAARIEAAQFSVEPPVNPLDAQSLGYTIRRPNPTSGAAVMTLDARGTHLSLTQAAQLAGKTANPQLYFVLEAYRMAIEEGEYTTTMKLSDSVVVVLYADLQGKEVSVTGLYYLDGLIKSLHTHGLHEFRPDRIQGPHSYEKGESPGLAWSFEHAFTPGLPLSAVVNFSVLNSLLSPDLLREWSNTVQNMNAPLGGLWCLAALFKDVLRSHYETWTVSRQGPFVYAHSRVGEEIQVYVVWAGINPQFCPKATRAFLLDDRTGELIEGYTQRFSATPKQWSQQHVTAVSMVMRLASTFDQEPAMAKICASRTGIFPVASIDELSVTSPKGPEAGKPVESITVWQFEAARQYGAASSVRKGAAKSRNTTIQVDRNLAGIDENPLEKAAFVKAQKRVMKTFEAMDRFMVEVGITKPHTSCVRRLEGETKSEFEARARVLCDQVTVEGFFPIARSTKYVDWISANFHCRIVGPRIESVAAVPVPEGLIPGACAKDWLRNRPGEGTNTGHVVHGPVAWLLERAGKTAKSLGELQVWLPPELPAMWQYWTAKSGYAPVFPMLPWMSLATPLGFDGTRAARAMYKSGEDNERLNLRARTAHGSVAEVLLTEPELTSAQYYDAYTRFIRGADSGKMIGLPTLKKFQKATKSKFIPDGISEKLGETSKRVVNNSEVPTKNAQAKLSMPTTGDPWAIHGTESTAILTERAIYHRRKYIERVNGDIAVLDGRNCPGLKVFDDLQAGEYAVLEITTSGVKVHPYSLAIDGYVVYLPNVQPPSTERSSRDCSSFGPTGSSLGSAMHILSQDGPDDRARVLLGDAVRMHGMAVSVMRPSLVRDLLRTFLRRYDANLARTQCGGEDMMPESCVTDLFLTVGVSVEDLRRAVEDPENVVIVPNMASQGSFNPASAQKDEQQANLTANAARVTFGLHAVGAELRKVLDSGLRAPPDSMAASDDVGHQAKAAVALRRTESMSGAERKRESAGKTQAAAALARKDGTVRPRPPSPVSSDGDASDTPVLSAQPEHGATGFRVAAVPEMEFIGQADDVATFMCRPAGGIVFVMRMPDGSYKLFPTAIKFPAHEPQYPRALAVEKRALENRLCGAEVFKCHVSRENYNTLTPSSPGRSLKDAFLLCLRNGLPRFWSGSTGDARTVQAALMSVKEDPFLAPIHPALSLRTLAAAHEISLAVFDAETILPPITAAPRKTKRKTAIGPTAWISDERTPEFSAVTQVNRIPTLFGDVISDSVTKVATRTVNGVDLPSGPSPAYFEMLPIAVASATSYRPEDLRGLRLRPTPQVSMIRSMATTSTLYDIAAAAYTATLGTGALQDHTVLPNGEEAEVLAQWLEQVLGLPVDALTHLRAVDPSVTYVCPGGLLESDGLIRRSVTMIDEETTVLGALIHNATLPPVFSVTGGVVHEARPGPQEPVYDVSQLGKHQRVMKLLMMRVLPAAQAACLVPFPANKTGFRLYASGALTPDETLMDPTLWVNLLALARGGFQRPVDFRRHEVWDAKLRQYKNVQLQPSRTMPDGRFGVMEGYYASSGHLPQVFAWDVAVMYYLDVLSDYPRDPQVMNYLNSLLSWDLENECLMDPTSFGRGIMDSLTLDHAQATVALEWKKSAVLTLPMQYTRMDAWNEIMGRANTAREAQELFLELRPDILPQHRTMIYIVAGDPGHNAIFPYYNGAGCGWDETPWREPLQAGHRSHALVMHIGEGGQTRVIVTPYNGLRTLAPVLKFPLGPWVSSVQVTGHPGRMPLRAFTGPRKRVVNGLFIGARDMSWSYTPAPGTERKPSPDDRLHRGTVEYTGTTHLISFKQMLLQMHFDSDDDPARFDETKTVVTLLPFTDRYTPANEDHQG